MSGAFLNHLKYASRLTKSWPKWKREAAGLTKRDNWHRYPVGKPKPHTCEPNNLARPRCVHCGKFVKAKTSA